jgi:CxxC-x17-CxxC domain-containing protein
MIMAFRDRDNDREDSRGGFGRDRGSRGGRSFGGNRGGGRSFGGGNRSFGGNRGGGRSFGRDRPRIEMHDAVCDSCQSECQVPFRPTKGKPVLCSNCFEAQGNSHGGSKGGRDRNPSSGTSGVSTTQFKELEAKIDKILYILENLEEDSVEEENEQEEEAEE